MYKYVVVYPTSFLTSMLMLQATTTKERSQLNTRLSFHLSHKFADEKKLMDESISHVKDLVGTVTTTFPDLA